MLSCDDVSVLHKNLVLKYDYHMKCIYVKKFQLLHSSQCHKLVHFQSTVIRGRVYFLGVQIL